MAYVLVWEFQARADSVAAFESAYGSDGEWARFFATGIGYLGTELLRDASEPRRYLTIDRWTSAEAYARFKEERRAEYAALDSRCEAWTERETPLGAWIA
jgi:heme-degrading monooxygenase HmoA